MALHFVRDDLDSATPGERIELTGAEAKHAAVVRRVRPGEAVTIGNGRGLWVTGAVVSATPELVQIEVADAAQRELPSPAITLVQALAKGDRDELAVQTATELGVDAVIPWQAERSVSRWEGKKADKALARWQTIAREAAKQAHRAFIPEVLPLAKTSDLVALAAKNRVLILDPWAKQKLAAIENDGRDIVLIVGPEGGISPTELEKLAAASAEQVLLGDTVLRTSSAGPAAIAVLSAKLGRW